MQKHLSRARQWALVDRGEGGGRERREGGEEDTAITHKYKHSTTRHTDTRRRKGILHGGNPKVGEGRSPDILLQGEVGVLNIQ